MSDDYGTTSRNLSAVAEQRSGEKPTRALNVALLGFGTVGESVARILVERTELQGRLKLTHVFNRNIARKRADSELKVPDHIDWVDWTENIESLFASKPDVIVEVIGGGTTSNADTWIRRALNAGIHVVTANKMLMGTVGHELLRLAARNGKQIRFEAAVGGGVPLIQSVREGLAGDTLQSVAGILNGTSNYVLSCMAARDDAEMSVVLEEARRLGFAEVDPSADIDGIDAAAKLAVLAGIAFRYHLDWTKFPRNSIEPIGASDFRYAKRLECTIRQISLVQSRGESSFHAFVGPALVPQGSSFGRNMGANNVVTLVGKYGGESSFSGAGAGGLATAVAVVSDLLALSQQDGSERAQVWESGTVVGAPARPYYLRFVVKDRPGILASISASLARQSINLDAVLQEPGYRKDALPFVITVEPCEESALRAAMSEIGNQDFNAKPPLVMPILLQEKPLDA